jgi:2'-5' RNA ligase
MQQTPLSGAARAPASGAHNLFFALQPDDDVRAAIAAAAARLKHEREPRGRWITPHRYHLTLLFLGNHAHLRDDLVDAALAAGDRVSTAPFALALDRAGSFANRAMPWWIGCSRLDTRLAALHDRIAAELRAQDRAVGTGNDFVAHVTILRDADRALPPTPIAPIEWPVGDFVLIDSRLGAEASHTVLRRWRLAI